VDWNELALTPEERDQLVRELGVHRPEDVVALAWAMPDALDQFIGTGAVERIRMKHPFNVRDKFDSSGFALGARAGRPTPEPENGRNDADFLKRRGDLIHKLSAAVSPLEKARIEGLLLKLYTGDSDTSRS
jgi:hypothetical protein